MSRELMLQLPRWVTQYGEEEDVPTSWWRIVSVAATCFIAGIPNEAQAEGVSVYLNLQAQLFTQILRPGRNGGPWSVMIDAA